MTGNIRRPGEEPHDALLFPKDDSKKPFSGKVWTEWKSDRSESPNLMTGGNHGPGGKSEDISLVDEIKSITWEDFKNVHKIPCARESFLVGIGGGFGLGAVRFVVGGSLIKACNWFVGTFVFSSVVVYEVCQRRRMLERQAMKRAVEVLDHKRLAKAEMEARNKKAERLAQAEATTKKSEEKKDSKNWWSFWSS